MLSSDRQNKTSKINVALTKIPGMCVGALSSPTGDTGRMQCTESDLGTTKINVKKQANSPGFLKL
jgi:hypothetical protein